MMFSNKKELDTRLIDGGVCSKSICRHCRANYIKDNK